MEETIKYFQPDITDIRVGYECEVKWHTYGDGINWRSYIVKAGDSILTTDNVRVPYLSKEQIEAEGWKRTYDFKNSVMTTMAFDKGFSSEYLGNYRVVVEFDRFTYNLKIYVETTDRRQTVLYSSNCKDINTFRYICKLLNIK